MSSSKKRAGLGAATRAVLAGRRTDEQFGFVNTPIYRGSTVLYEDVAAFKGRRARYPYGRRGSPTIEALQDAMNELEGSDGTMLTPAGASAMSVAILSAVKAGDHLLMVDSAYQPTRTFCDGLLKRFGVQTEYYDPLVGAGIEALIRENTGAIFLESPGSLTFEMQDVPAITKVARAHGVTTLMDNTWATPLYFRPLDHGVDISMQSATKYIVGHSDALLGTISASGEAWKKVASTHGDLGLMAGPDDIYLALRGLRTMPLRLEAQAVSGLEVATWLAKQLLVSRVLHPGLANDPGHAIWRRDFSGASSLFGVLFDAALSGPAIDAFIDALDLFGIGASWGGYESLVIPCNPNTFRTARPLAEPGTLVRLHVGLEDTADLIADLDAALGVAQSMPEP